MGDRGMSRPTHLTTGDRAYYRKLDFRMGYAPARKLLGLGALAAVIIGCAPLFWLLFNKFVRFIATIGVAYKPYRDPALKQFTVMLPDLVLLALFGAGAAYCRMYSTRYNKFYMMRTRQGTVRVGWDDAFSVLAGTPLLWFMFYRHGWGKLFFITGAAYGLFPVIGYILGSFWRSVYSRLVARMAPVPAATLVPATVWHTYRTTPDMVEMFRLEDVGWNEEQATLTLTGRGSDALRQGGGEDRLEQYVRAIDAVAERDPLIRIVDSGRFRPAERNVTNTPAGSGDSGL